MDRHLTDDELALHYYGEMGDAAEARAESHLDACRACRDQLERLQQVFAIIDADSVPEPDERFEARAWQRLEPVLHQTRAAAPWTDRLIPQ